ncbi:hypothetical protein MRB53_037377 [Persea americana]|nr:hypothetical protein MRB53_037377 [Persea americana]
MADSTCECSPGASASDATKPPVPNSLAAQLSAFVSSYNAANPGARSNFPSLPYLLPSSLTTTICPRSHVIASPRSSSTYHLHSSHLAIGTPLADLPTAADDESADPIEKRTLIEALTDEQQRDILAKVLRSPAFSQGVKDIDNAVREGGADAVGRAMQVNVMRRARGRGSRCASIREGFCKGDGRAGDSGREYGR